MAWAIDRDHFQPDPDTPTRVGVEGAITVEGEPLPSRDPETGEEYPRIRFRTLDEDGERYYDGWLHDDPFCDNEESALSYATYDAGAVIIEVRRDGEWVQDLG